jgi:antitoxin YefM
MTTTFRMDASELNSSFLQKLQTLFEDKKLVITVEEEMDETEYLLSSEENRVSLQKSMEQLRNGDLIQVSLEDLRK